MQDTLTPDPDSRKTHKWIICFNIRDTNCPSDSKAVYADLPDDVYHASLAILQMKHLCAVITCDDTSTNAWRVNREWEGGCVAGGRGDAAGGDGDCEIGGASGSGGLQVTRWAHGLPGDKWWHLRVAGRVVPPPLGVEGTTAPPQAEGAAEGARVALWEVGGVGGDGLGMWAEQVAGEPPSPCPMKQCMGCLRFPR
ncbi:hypothetical protein E2C01_037983 [Portunus trituberculatus]|uniref:Uncharacterized protein n=1 Tax=Portunus trituberculatus TaxID=210409 RepID=A0A5B7F9L2_PORTR|nr:hypothetical protein [Portunus trituberculatus]